MLSVKISLTVALWAVPRYRLLDKNNPVKITCFIPIKYGDLELDELLEKVVIEQVPMVEVVVEADVLDSFIFFLNDYLTKKEIKISKTKRSPTDELFVEYLD